jgi:hypothetical protein
VKGNRVDYFQFITCFSLVSFNLTEELHPSQKEYFFCICWIAMLEMSMQVISRNPS